MFLETPSFNVSFSYRLGMVELQQAEDITGEAEEECYRLGMVELQLRV